MKRGEHPENALIREIKEETNVELEDMRLFGIYPGTHPDPLDPCAVLSIVYLAKAKGEKLQAHDDVVQSRWFAKGELPARIALDTNQGIIKDFLKAWK